MAKNIFDIGKLEQYRTVKELIDESQSNGTYYILLILSSIIISSGVLLANSAILIGGMLVTPILTPVLLIALGLTTGKGRLLGKTFILICKSVLIVFFIALIETLIFSVPDHGSQFFDSVLFNNSLRAAGLYFLVAFASGMAATFAWAHKDTSDILPGISIAVSIVPPIALVATWVAALDFEKARFFLFVFIFNMIGIIMSSMIVFSLLKFYRTERQIDVELNREGAQKVAQDQGFIPPSNLNNQ